MRSNLPGEHPCHVINNLESLGYEQVPLLVHVPVHDRATRAWRCTGQTSYPGRQQVSGRETPHKPTQSQFSTKIIMATSEI